MRRCITTCAVALFLLPAASQAQGVALSLKAGTLGPSVGLVIGASNKLNLRVDVPYFKYDHSLVHEVRDFDVDVDAGVDLFSAGGLLDFHPGGGGFRLSAGAMYNDNQITFAGQSASSQKVGDQTYTPEQIGTLSGTIQMGSQIAPYAGLGFGNAVGANKKFGLTMDLGVLFQGSPKVTMNGTGMIAPTAEEASKIESNLDWAKYYPVFSIGITYKVR